MARPEKEVDPQQVIRLAELGCTLDEMGSVLGVSSATLTRRFAEEIDKGKAELKTKLRRLQIRAAEKGNVVMLIWLGKQLLGQKEKSDEELAAAINQHVPLSVEQILQLIKEAKRRD